MPTDKNTPSLAETTTSKRTNWSLGAALSAAVAASACCTIPLARVSLGIGGAWVGSLPWSLTAGSLSQLL